LPDSLRGRPAPAAAGPGADLPEEEPDWTRDPLAPTPGGERKRFFAWTRRRQTVSSDAEAPLDDVPPPPFERPAERGFDRGSSRVQDRAQDRAQDGGFERGGDRAPGDRGFDRAPPAPPPFAPSAPDAPAAAEAAPVTVLKSGVIDGMGYTLYTDGSIDAAFEHGTLRFDSIDDLRRHLEQSHG
ncbi:hypothetical protein CH338_30900, partial [Rhodoplanes elegans]